MILQSLYQLAKDEQLVGDPDFEIQAVSWIVELTDDGRLIQIAPNRSNLNEGKTDKKGKPIKPKWVGKNVEVPLQPGRTSGDLAFAFVDKPEYSLGIDPAGKRDAEKLAVRAALFREIVANCARDTDDPAVVALAAYLQKHSPTDEAFLAMVPEELSANDQVAFRVGETNQLVHQRPAVRQWWKQQRRRDVPPMDARFRCLVTGEPMNSPGLVPLIKPVPGGTPSGVAMVSFNTGAFESYGLNGNENAPISDAAAQHVSAAMNRLLSARPVDGHGKTLPVRRITLSGDTVVVYWSPDGEPDALEAFIDLHAARSAESVGEVYRGVWYGKPPHLTDTSRFYAAVVTGTQGRAIFRGYIDTTVKRAYDSLAVYFEQIRNVRNASPAKGEEHSPAVPLRAILDSLAAPGRESSVPPSLAAAIMLASIDDRRRLPVSALEIALLRERAEAGDSSWVGAARRDARAAIIKGVLVREFKVQLENVMDPTIDNIGYQLGMLTAILERLQAIAIDNPNASVVDRYFVTASAAPAAVFPRLLKLARHHVRKAKGSDKQSERVAAARYERLIDTISTRFLYDPKSRTYPQPTAFPLHLSLKDQGLFVLGYHQMRHWLWMNNDERLAWEEQHAGAPRAFLWKSGKDAEEEPEPAEPANA